MKDAITGQANFLLGFIGVVVVPATTKKFIAREKFAINISNKDLVRISNLGDNFKEWFLYKIEEPISEVTLCYQELLKDSVDGPIIAELGGVKKAETTLAEMFFLIDKQREGKNRVLLTTGHANIFYVRDDELVLRAVRIYCGDNSWDIDAGTIDDPDRWGDGWGANMDSIENCGGEDRVFSRNF
ncbi:MAG: hypothetical protein ABH818_00585 [Patescibacteria group bacterium]